MQLKNDLVVHNTDSLKKLVLFVAFMKLHHIPETLIFSWQ